MREACANVTLFLLSCQFWRLLSLGHPSRDAAGATAFASSVRFFRLTDSLRACFAVGVNSRVCVEAGAARLGTGRKKSREFVGGSDRLWRGPQ